MMTWKNRQGTRQTNRERAIPCLSFAFTAGQRWMQRQSLGCVLQNGSTDRSDGNLTSVRSLMKRSDVPSHKSIDWTTISSPGVTSLSPPFDSFLSHGLSCSWNVLSLLALGIHCIIDNAFLVYLSLLRIECKGRKILVRVAPIIVIRSYISDGSECRERG